MVRKDLSNVEEATEFPQIKPGGYICGITKVENVPDKEYLKIEYDIAEGPLKNYWRGLSDKFNFWGGTFYCSYKDSALPFFKSFVTAVEKSNPGYKWDWNEDTLSRKLIGLVLGEEEYVSTATGEIKTRLYVKEKRSADSIRKGDFKVPELKKLKAENLPPVPEYQPAKTAEIDDMPF